MRCVESIINILAAIDKRGNSIFFHSPSESLRKDYYWKEYLVRNSQRHLKSVHIAGINWYSRNVSTTPWPPGVDDSLPRTLLSFHSRSILSSRLQTTHSFLLKSLSLSWFFFHPQRFSPHIQLICFIHKVLITRPNWNDNETNEEKRIWQSLLSKLSQSIVPKFFI